MRRTIMFSFALAVSTVLLGACGPKAETPKPMPATPTPVATVNPAASPVTSPSIDPKSSPAKPVASPEAKSTDGKTNVNTTAVKPSVSETPKK